jgi:hypothetical protein
MAKATKQAAKANGKSDAAKIDAYREGSSYWAVVETLRRCGIGKMVKAETLVKMYPSVVGKEAFAAFKAKKSRNKESGKGWEDRIIQNAIVVNRPDYGQPLRAEGFEVRKDRNEEGYEFGLFRYSGPVPTAKARKATDAKATPKAKATASKGGKAAQKAPTARKGNGKGKAKPKASKAA